MPSFLIHFKGEILSLAAAVGWAFAVVLYKKSGERVHPIALNLGKNTVGAFCFGLIILFFFKDTDKMFLHLAHSGGLKLLILSGIMGIGIADSLFFWSLNLLGASLSAIIDCMIVPFVILLSFIFLNETLSAIQFLGTAMIVFGVLISTDLKRSTHLTPRRLWGGIGVGVLSMAVMALGIIIMKPVLSEVPLIHIVFIRLLAGIFLLWLNLLFLPNRRRILRSLFARHGFTYTLSASFIGGFVVLLIWMAGFKYAQASIASALNQMSNVFIFLFAALILKESVDGKKIVAILMAVSGALLVTFG